MSNHNNLRILLIEDDQIEILKFNRIVSQLDVKPCIDYAENGEEAIDKIFGDNPIIPDLILLDLNMPLFSGREFLTEIKTNSSKLNYVPVVILTTSENRKDILYCYQQGIAGYFIKPLEYDVYAQIITNIINYWSINQFVVKE